MNKALERILNGHSYEEALDLFHARAVEVLREPIPKPSRLELRLREHSRASQCSPADQPCVREPRLLTLVRRAQQALRLA